MKKQDKFYDKIVAAERTLSVIKHNSVWHFDVVKQMTFDSIQRLKALLTEAELLLDIESEEKSPHCCCDTDLVCALHPPNES